MNFDFNAMTDSEKLHLANVMLEPLESSEDIRNWAKMFLDLEIPLEVTDPESNSTPLDAIFQIYNTFKNNTGDINPGYIMVSCREGMKTISVAILEVLLFLHFYLEIAHAGAIEAQSYVGLQYIEGFLLKIDPLLKVAGWTNISQNKRLIKYRAPNNRTPFIKVVICSAKGMNSLHCNAIFLDELDLADPVALREAVNIVSHSRGIHGVQVFLSTLKYAFGNMIKALDSAEEKNYKVLKWNILDVTERCGENRHLPNEPKEDRYVAKDLPLKQISKEEYDFLADVEKNKFNLIKDAFKGCTTCSLLPVCKMNLAKKTTNAVGGFYKPISTVIQKFKENSPEIAVSQLLCLKPGSEGLVYPRFNTEIDKGNVLSIGKAWETLMGSKNKNVTEIELIEEMKKLDIPFYAGVDFGFTHPSVILICASIPNGEIWGIDCFSASGLEFDEVLHTAMTYRDRYSPIKWYADQAMPALIKSFNKNGMKSPKFTKDVNGGIEALRTKIQNSNGTRNFKVLNTDSNKKVISALSKHRFKIDSQGNPTGEPGDEIGVSDICDPARYLAQNLFPVRGTYSPQSAWVKQDLTGIDNIINPTPNQQMIQEIQKRMGTGRIVTLGTKKRGGFHFSF